MLFATWRPTSCHPGISIAFAAHLHGRDLLVEQPAAPHDAASLDGRIGDGVKVTIGRCPAGGAAVPVPPEAAAWHWQVVAPSGRVLAEGDAPDRSAAEAAAEDEVEAVHPPSDDLIEALLG